MITDTFDTMVILSNNGMQSGDVSGLSCIICPTTLGTQESVPCPSTTLSSIAEAVKDFKGKMVFVDLFTSVLISSPSDLRSYQRDCTERAKSYIQEMSILKEHPDKEVIIIIFRVNSNCNL